MPARRASNISTSSSRLFPAGRGVPSANSYHDSGVHRTELFLVTLSALESYDHARGRRCSRVS
jgi:hypothetical protein